MTGWVLAIFLSGLAAACVRLLPPLHPAQLWTVPWAVSSLLYACRLLPYRSLSWTTTILAATAAAAFVASTLVGERVPTAGRARALRLPEAKSLLPTVALLAAGLTLVWLSAFLAQAVSAYGVHDTLVSSSAVRYAVSAGEFSVTIKFVYPALAATALAAATAGYADGRGTTTLWFLLAGASASCIYFATGRSTVVAAILIAVVAYTLSRPTTLSRRRYLLAIGALGLFAAAIFVAGGALIGKTFENNRSLQQLPSVFARHHRVQAFALPYQYASAPIAALDVQVRASSAWGEARGCASFREICSVLRAAGVRAPDVPRVRPFTAPPLIWNTYTALDLPLLDGGKGVAVQFIAAVGLILGAVWRKVRERSIGALLAYSILSAALVSSSGSFSFTAPHLVGAILVCGVGIVAADVVRRARARPSLEQGDLSVAPPGERARVRSEKVYHGIDHAQTPERHSVPARAPLTEQEVIAGTQGPGPAPPAERPSPQPKGQAHPVRRVAFVMPRLNSGGAERVAINMAAAAPQSECVVIVERRGGDLSEDRAADRAVFASGDAPLSSRLVRVVRLARAIRRVQPDLVVSMLSPFVSTAASRLVGVPIMHWLQAPWSRTLPGGRGAPRLAARTGLRSVIFASRLVAAATPGLLDECRSLGIPKEKLALLPNGLVLPGELTPLAPEVGTKGPLLVSVGRLEPPKRQDLLIKAFARLRADTAARLLLLGTGRLESELRRLCETLGVADAVEFLGYVPEPLPFVAAADVFVLATDYEGFGNVIVEALACGVRVVVSDVPYGPRFILNDGAYGDLVPPRSIQALHDGIRGALAKGPLSGAERGAARTRAERFGIAPVAERFERLVRVATSPVPVVDADRLWD